MASTFHMDTDADHQVAEPHIFRSDTVRNEAQALVSSVRSMDWYGDIRDQIRYVIEQLICQYYLAIYEILKFSSRTNTKAAKWEEIDRLFIQLFSKINISRSQELGQP